MNSSFEDPSLVARYKNGDGRLDKLDGILTYLVDNVELIRHRVELRHLKPADGFNHNERLKGEAKQEILALFESLIPDGYSIVQPDLGEIPDNAHWIHFKGQQYVINQILANLQRLKEK